MFLSLLLSLQFFFFKESLAVIVNIMSTTEDGFCLLLWLLLPPCYIYHEGLT